MNPWMFAGPTPKKHNTVEPPHNGHRGYRGKWPLWGGRGVVFYLRGGATFLFKKKKMLIVAYKYITQSNCLSIKQKPKINVQKKNVNKNNKIK